jgi:hypothetical protein
MRLRVVILAAGRGTRMSGVLLSSRWGVPKSLLEAGRRPVIIELLENLHAQLQAEGWTPEYRIVTGPASSALRRFFVAYAPALPKELRLKWILQPRPIGPLDAAARALPSSGPVLIWPADTMAMTPRRWLLDSLFVREGYYDPSRWALLEAGPDGAPRFLFKHSGLPRRALAFTGAALLSDAALLCRACRDARGGELHHALEQYACARPLRLARARVWVDAGSPDTFLKAKESLLERISTHHVRLENGLMRKSMRARPDETSLGQSVVWFAAAHRVNRRLRRALPTPVRFDGATLTLPYRDWPSLADWRLYRSLYLPREAASTFDSFLDFVVRDLHAAFAPAGAVVRDADRRLIVDKTRTRIERVCDRAMLNRRHFLNGRLLPNWETASRWLEEAAATLPAQRAEDWRSVHGDLVLSNALTDGDGGVFIIDPRSAYAGAPVPFGDRHYDYAKLGQCVHSRYDEIKKDEFALSTSRGRTRLNLPLAATPGRARWEGLLRARARREGLDAGRLRLMEASLLLGLLPFHQDRPQQVHAFYLRGLDLLARIRDGRLD